MEEDGGLPKVGTQGGPSTGLRAGLFGCLAAFAFAFATAPVFLFVWAWSGAHCEPVPQCQRFAERTLLLELAVVLALAALLGLSVRALVSWWRRRQLDPAAAGWPPLWAVAAVLVLVPVAAYFGGAMFGVH